MFVIDPPRPTVLLWGLWFSDPAERITLNRPISLVIRRAIFRSKDNQSSKSVNRQLISLSPYSALVS